MRVSAALFLLLACSPAAFAICPVERATVKAATDTNAGQINPIAFPGVIATLHSIPAPRPLPQDGRIAPDETTMHSILATLIAYRITPESEIQLVLSDEMRRTILATIPSMACVATSSRFHSQVADARTQFERRFTATNEFQEVREAIEVRGVGFFDFLRGQRGLAPNGFSLYPVTSVNFFLPFQPKPPPPAPARRRSAGRCALSSFSITSSKTKVCAGEDVTIAWQSSDPSARVSIDGIGSDFPATGSQVVMGHANIAYSGRAITSCGSSDEAVAIVNLQPLPIAALSGPADVWNGRPTTFTVTVDAGATWALTSSLGSTVEPSSGASSGAVIYTATHDGNDNLTLSASRSGCESPLRTFAIRVSTLAPNHNPPPTSTPPPSSNNLLCCDGTFSPRCFNCADDNRGCCSSHGGICGCRP